MCRLKPENAPDLVCLGELLIDFVSTSIGPLRDAPGFVKAPGGAPANVAAAAARLGVRSAFLGAVGDDEFGRFLAGALEDCGVDVSGLSRRNSAATPLAFVSLRNDAERDFLFYWSGTADHHMKPHDIPIEMVDACRVFHFGSISLIHPAPRLVTRRALRRALDGRIFVSCDPNLRLNLWPSPSAARRAVLKAIEPAHLVKVNDDELAFLTGKSDLLGGIEALARFSDAAVLVTRGAAGASFRWHKAAGEVRGFAVNAVDSTGAGDGFVAGILRCLLQIPAELRRIRPDSTTIAGWVRYANAVGALTTTRRGAIPAFPTDKEVADLIGTIDATGHPASATA
jgi:fructokinase